MVVEQENKVMLFAEPNPNNKGGVDSRSTNVTVTSGSKGPVLEASSSSAPTDSAPTPGQAVAGGGAAGPVSRGYKEEMEDFAYCVRMYEQAGSEKEKQEWLTKPRCHGRIAMQDAIIALASNAAMQTRERILFQDEWFDAASDKIPSWDRKVSKSVQES